MLLIRESHSAQDILELISGQSRFKMNTLISLVFHHRVQRMQKTCSTQWAVLIRIMIQLSTRCIRRLTATLHQASKRIGSTTGSLIQVPMCSVMERRELNMVLPWLLPVRDMRTNSQKLLSSRRLLKIIEQLLLTYLEFQRIQDKVRPIEEMISSMALRIFKALIHGMLVDVFTESQLSAKSNLISISANQ